MNKKYDHKEVESRIYRMWEDGGYFTPDRDADKNSGKKPFTIVLPPPNSNGKLHTGHALMVALEDLMIRRKKMQGYSALWIPGTDHAGFETQAVFEKHLKKEGKSRLDFDRETFYNMVYGFVKEQGTIIYDQIRSLGPAIDWSRSKFTLNDDVINTVYSTFKKMAADGMVYRDDYMVNYCTFCGTTLSDLETEHKEKQTPLYYIKYKLIDRKNDEPEYLVVATTRPEPIFVDTHLAINPDDEDKKWLLGRQLLNPLTNEPMIIVEDSFVDPEFGTGLVKLTPAHDKNDYEVAKKLNLPLNQAIGVDGKIIENEASIELGMAGLYVKPARARTVEILQERGLIDHIDDKYTNSSSVCYKCKNAIEPMILPNWFVKVEDFKAPAHEAVKTGKVKIYPKWQEVKYHRWMEEMRDWPISRQIAWGIRIPAWYSAKENPDLHVTFITKSGESATGSITELLSSYSMKEILEGLQSLIAPKDAKYELSADCPGEDYLPETDTFDTWYSSGQWPLVTLGYPDSEDFKYFYPTAVLETGWEILRFWVSRMIMFGIYLTGEPPFKDVYLHGLVRAADGRKMSKSLGNQVDPLDVVETHGADALRMGLIAGTAGGKDFSYPEDKVTAYRNFANKIWNMARFMLMMMERDGYDVSGLEATVASESNLEGPQEKTNVNTLPWFEKDMTIDGIGLNEQDTQILDGLSKIIKSVDKDLDKYRFAQAAENIYHFVWDEVASKYIEDVKEREGASKVIGLSVLRHVYMNSLKLLHPFMPFVTEEIWSHLPRYENVLVNAQWPGKLAK